ncbi:MAG: helix-turn-helix domain-containing protein [Candidatus Competibacteraceae bacterium]
MKELMNVHEAADVIGVHVETVRKWLAKGDLTGSLTPAGWRITPDDIDAWLAKYRRQALQRQPEPQDTAS